MFHRPAISKLAGLLFFHHCYHSESILLPKDRFLTSYDIYLKINPKIMSNSTTLWGTLISVSLLASACSKEVALEPEFNEQSLRGKPSKTEAPVSKQFRMSAKTWYRINNTPSASVPEVPGAVSFANLPGAGSGTALNMGNIGTWFNQLAFSPTGEAPWTGTVAAPLVEASTYPQDGLRSVTSVINWLQLPTSINGNVIWSVVYNAGGDAVFLAMSGPSTSVVESDGKISFSGDGIIVGGRGKFENASGTYHFTGYLNPNDLNDGEYAIDGSISY